MFESLKPARSRFRAVLLGSVALHLALVVAIYGSWVYGVALKFGSIQWDDGGQARHLEKVAMVDRTKPLYMPQGFYAVEKPPAEVVRRERPPERERPKPEKPEPEEPESDGADEKTAEGEPVEEPEKPAGDMRFGRISGNALKPHIQQVYSAYEKGLIDVSTFTVTVTCKVERDGSFSDIRVVKSSGSEMIDRTAVNLFRELSDMRALAPLSALSSVSLTLDVGPNSSALTAVGFAGDPGVSQEFANQLGLIKFGARLKARTADERALIDNITVTQSGNRVSVRLGLPNSTAGDMMERNFGRAETAGT